MVKNCCIKTCKSESYGGCGISFHSFPKREGLNQKWLDVVPVSRRITKNAVVCSLHFKPTDFLYGHSRPMLKTNAVPSIFPEVQKQLELSDLKRSSQPDIIPTPSTFQESSTEMSSPHPSPCPSPCSSTRSSDQISVENNCSNFQDVAVQTGRYNSPAEDGLRRKVKILSKRLQRREAQLKKFKLVLAILKKQRKLHYLELEHNYHKKLV